jgi:hypothetical protein
MKRERIARVALRAFPATARSAHGEEMLGTLLDVSGASRARFARELIDFVRSGMRARATQTAQAGAQRIVADGVRLSCVWLLTLFASSELANRIRGFDPLGPWHPLAPWSLALLVAALALTLIGYDRLAGVTALLCVATLVADPVWRDQTFSRRELMVVPVICFITLALTPRRREPDHRRLAWLTLAAALALASSASDDPTAALVIFGLLVLVPPALGMLPTDPRLAIACALPVTSFGIHMAQDRGGPGVLGVVFLCAAPLILTLSVTRTRRLQAQTRR